MKDTARGIWTHASNAQADLLCPGRHRLGLDPRVPPEPENPDAAFGRLVHTALCLGAPEGLNEPQRQSYEACLEVEQRAFEAWQNHTGRAKEPFSMFTERRLWVEFENGLKHSGRFDRAYRQGPDLLIVDYKSLWGDIPDATVNRQLRDLAVLADANFLGVETIATAIVQPPANRTPVLAVYNEADLERARDELEKRVRASHDENSPRIAGALQCMYCPAKTLCKEYQDWHARMLPVPENLVTVPCADWSPMQWDLFLSRRKVAAKWLEDTEKYARALLEKNPQAIPGWSLTPNAPRHPIDNPQLVWERFEALGGKLEDFMACIKITKEDLESAVRYATKSKGAKLAEHMVKLLEGATKVSPISPSLTRKES